MTYDKTPPSVDEFKLSDTSLKIGDTATVTLKFSEVVTAFSSNDDITVVNGLLTTMTSSDSITWTGIFTPTVDIEDTHNILTLATTYKDIVGNTGVGNTTDHFLIDTTAPTLISVGVVSNNTNYTTFANAGDIITLTLTSREPIKTPVVIFTSHNFPITDTTITYTNTTVNTWTAVYTTHSNDIDGLINHSIAYEDLYGNIGTPVTTGSGTINYNNVLPILSNVNIISDNDTNTLAKSANIITLSFTASEVIRENPVITFLSGGAAITTAVTVANTGNTWTAKYTTDVGDTEGNITYSIAFSDRYGNAGILVTTIPDFIIDTTEINLTQVTVISTPSNDTTPSYIFTTNKAGTITTNIDEGFSTPATASTGSHQTITFNTLPEDTYTNKTITVTDTAGNSGSITIPDFIIDTTEINLTQVTVISTPSNDTTPSYIFTTNKAGTITTNIDEGFSLLTLHQQEVTKQLLLILYQKILILIKQ